MSNLEKVTRSDALARGATRYFTDKKDRPSSMASLDRIDISKGYVLGNVAVISLKANTLKNNADIEQLRRILSYVEKYGVSA